MKLYNKCEKTLAGCILLLLVLVGGAQVFCRYVIHLPVAWLEEFVIFSSIWGTYLGASSAANESRLTSVGLLVDAFPKFPRVILNVISQLLWLLCCIGLIITGWSAMSLVYARKTATLGGRFPYWVGMLAVPVGMTLIAVRVVMLMVKTIKNYSQEQDRISAADAMRKEIEDEIDTLGEEVSR